MDPKLPQDGWALQSEGDCSDQKDDSNDKVLEALGVLEQVAAGDCSDLILQDLALIAEACVHIPDQIARRRC